MNNISPFCSCKKMDCPLHPTKHDKGCAPCISKNLKSREIPNCFFDLLPGSESRSGDFFEDFARQVFSGRSDKG